MKKLRLSLIAASAVCAVAASAMTFTSVAAADDYREVTLTGTNVFYAGAGGAQISVHRFTEGSDYTDYTSFIIGEDQTVAFRKNLAYSWYALNESDVVEHNTFSMEIGFTELNFESYVIRFQSQQYNITEDGVTENYLVFVPDGDNLNLYVSETEEIADDEQPTYVIEEYSTVSIGFGDYADGNYSILVNGIDSGADFVNVREAYASYVSSGDSAATPLTFSATFAEDAGEDVTCEMIMRSLNGQSFEVFDAEEDANGNLSGFIHDDMPPVVCLAQGINYLTYGEEVDIDYTVIDVIGTSPRTTVKYYVLSTEDFNAADFDYNDTSAEDLFRDVTTSSDYRLIREPNTYVPDSAYDAATGFIETDGYKTYGLVKLCLYVRDTSSSSAQGDYVFIDWYVPGEYKVDINDIKQTDRTVDSGFIRMVEDLQGTTYAGDAVNLEEYEARIAQIEEEYQQKIDDYIAENYPDGLFASSDANLYLPDFSGYVTDNLGGYTDLQYRIYYSASSTGSTGTLDYNELAMSISEADVTYRFTIYVTDAADNEMYYPDENGELQTISTDDIWDEDFADLLPFFEVSVSYKSATVETPGLQSVGYVGSTYNSASFDITGVSGTYSTAYYLYIFDRDRFYREQQIELSYNDVISSVDALFSNTYREGLNTRQYFTLVTDDEEYADYEWDSTNVTFVPQDSTEYYVVRLELKDTGLSNTVTNSFLVVRASARAAEIYGEDNWVQNNIASIVLFCVAGVCFIAFIVLLIVKPKDKGDIDAIALEIAGDDDKPSKGGKRKGKK